MWQSSGKIPFLEMLPDLYLTPASSGGPGNLGCPFLTVFSDVVLVLKGFFPLLLLRLRGGLLREMHGF